MRETRIVNGVTFTAWPEHGAWYEDPTDGRTGRNAHGPDDGRRVDGDV
jgi:hypothetical protein